MPAEIINTRNYRRGYRREEELVKLIKKPKPIDAKINTEIGRVINFSKKDATKAINEAVAAKFINECDAPVLFPYLKWHKPQGAEWQIVEHTLSESELKDVNSANLVELVTNHRLSFRVFGFYEYNIYLPANITGELKAHLADGYCAYIKMLDGNMVWMPVPTYYALQEWQEHKKEYEHQVCDWNAIMGRIEKIESFDQAIRQHEVFKKLDFDWCVTTHNFVPNIDWLVSGDKAPELHIDADDKNLHIMVLDGENKGRMLCMSEDTVPSAIATAYAYDCYAGDLLIKKIPHKITCVSCHMAAVNFICDKEESK